MTRIRPLSCALLMAVVLLALLPVTPPASAASTYLCTGYVGCKEDGYSHFGYRGESDKMWWRMYSGHNCTNYVAYRLVKRGMSSERPWDGTGMAYNWGRANRDITDQTPMVGSVAWWNKNHNGVGSSGHVAYVQQVLSNSKIIISEDSWSGDFHWRKIKKSGGSWPSGFVHFDDEAVEVRESPSINGTPAVGQTLTVSVGRWNRSAAYQYQWLADGKAISGATSSTLTPTVGMLHKQLQVRVRATSRGYVDGVATSSRSAKVRKGTMSVTASPTISGVVRVDEDLTVTAGTWSPTPDSTSIRWYADGKVLEGETGRRLHLGQGLIRKQITVRMTALLEGYAASKVTSAPTVPVAAGHIDVTQPFTLGGAARLGRTLTVTPGTYDPANSDVTYTWLRNGHAVSGATGRTYELDEADLGKRISVQVRLSHTGYQTRTIVLDTDGVVRTVPDLRVTATGKSERAVVTLRVTAPGVASPGGRATVQIGRQEVTERVVDGHLRVVLDDLPAGTRTVKVSYAGTDVILPGRARTTVRVLR